MAIETIITICTLIEGNKSQKVAFKILAGRKTLTSAWEISWVHKFFVGKMRAVVLQPRSYNKEDFASCADFEELRLKRK